jgi:Tol biopolymer transport system component
VPTLVAPSTSVGTGIRPPFEASLVALRGTTGLPWLVTSGSATQLELGVGPIDRIGVASTGDAVVALVHNAAGNRHLVVVSWRSGSRGLTEVPVAGDVDDPVWSPAGDAVAFSFRDERSWQIGIFDFSTGVVRVIADDPSDDRHPSWSPDGQMIAFSSRRLGASPSLFTFRMSTGQVASLGLSEDVGQSAWTSDGQRLVYERSSGAARELAVIAVVNTNSPGTRVTDAAEKLSDPATSLSDDRILAVETGTGGTGLVAIDLTTRKTERVTSPGTGDSSPSIVSLAALQTLRRLTT